jgi:Zn2+/Cd2+-exporting ATPase
MASQVGVSPSEVTSDMSPEQKAIQVQELQKSGKQVFMVGDGLNDAPALAQADVSAAFADSAESAVAGAADILLLRDSGTHAAVLSAPGDIGRVAFAISVARAVRRNVQQNLAIAFTSMVCAAVPSVLGLLPLWTAVLLHEGSTVLVALNSCRLLLMGPVADSEQS